MNGFHVCERRLTRRSASKRGGSAGFVPCVYFCLDSSPFERERLFFLSDLVVKPRNSFLSHFELSLFRIFNRNSSPRNLIRFFGGKPSQVKRQAPKICIRNPFLPFVSKKFPSIRHPFLTRTDGNPNLSLSLHESECFSTFEFGYSIIGL